MIFIAWRWKMFHSLANFVLMSLRIELLWWRQRWKDVRNGLVKNNYLYSLLLVLKCLLFFYILLLHCHHLTSHLIDLQLMLKSWKPSLIVRYSRIPTQTLPLLCQLILQIHHWQLHTALLMLQLLDLIVQQFNDSLWMLLWRLLLLLILLIYGRSIET